jgi:hypothetical protein
MLKERMMISTLTAPTKLKWKIRRLILLFIIGLVISGLTAFPLEWEMDLIQKLFQRWQWNNDVSEWIQQIYQGIKATNAAYPFVAYGTDWLAFAHIIIAIVFIGPFLDPVKNKWVIEFGLVACISIFPFAFIAGEVRGIPLYWRMIDCMFGLLGGLLLWICYRKIKKLEGKK